VGHQSRLASIRALEEDEVDFEDSAECTLFINEDDDQSSVSVRATLININCRLWRYYPIVPFLEKGTPRG